MWIRWFTIQNEKACVFNDSRNKLNSLIGLPKATNPHHCILNTWSFAILVLSRSIPIFRFWLHVFVVSLPLAIKDAWFHFCLLRPQKKPSPRQYRAIYSAEPGDYCLLLYPYVDLWLENTWAGWCDDIRFVGCVKRQQFPAPRPLWRTNLAAPSTKVRNSAIWRGCFTTRRAGVFGGFPPCAGDGAVIAIERTDCQTKRLFYGISVTECYRL